MRANYEAGAPFVKAGGVVALHNSADRLYDADHDGHRRLAVEAMKPPLYADVKLVDTTHIGRKTRAGL